MKKVSGVALAILALLLVSIIPSVYGQQNDNQLPDPGILPDNQFYGLKRFFEGVWISLTFGDDLKALRTLELAQTRLAEAHAMASAEKPEFVGTLLNQYTEELANANKLAASLTDDKKAVVSERIAIATTQHIPILDNLEQKVPEGAKPMIIAVRENSIKGNMQALKDLASKNPQKAADIAMDLAKGRADDASEAARDGHQKEALKAIEDVKAYKDLADQIKTTSKDAEKHDPEGKKSDNSTRGH